MNSADRIQIAKNIIAKFDAHRVANDYKAIEFTVWAKGDHVRIYTDNGKHGYLGINKDGNIIDPLKTAKSSLYSYAIESEI